VTALRRRLTALTVVIGVILALGAGLAVTSASAATPHLLLAVTGDPAGWTTAPTTPVFGSDHLGAGQSVSGTVGVRNSGTGTGVLSMRLADVSGALAPELQLSVAQIGAGAAPWSGSVADLTRGIVLDASMPAGAEIHSTVTATVPAGLGNEWAGATTSFHLVWTLSDTGLAAAVGVGRSSTVVAAAGGTAAPTPARSGQLAFTGGYTLALLLMAAVLLALGVLVTVGDRRLAAGSQASAGKPAKPRS
jgi:hypothetical protein